MPQAFDVALSLHCDSISSTVQRTQPCAYLVVAVDGLPDEAVVHGHLSQLVPQRNILQGSQQQMQVARKHT
jgi:hypothetical protein